MRDTNFPGSCLPCMECCTNSCVFRRDYHGSILRFDKDPRSKGPPLPKIKLENSNPSQDSL